MDYSGDLTISEAMSCSVYHDIKRKQNNFNIPRAIAIIDTKIELIE